MLKRRAALVPRSIVLALVWSVLGLDCAGA